MRRVRERRGNAGVQEAVGGVDHPDGEEHGGWLGPGEMDVGAAGDEDGPEGGYGGGVEGEEMPEGEGGVAGRAEAGRAGGVGRRCGEGRRDGWAKGEELIG